MHKINNRRTFLKNASLAVGANFLPIPSFTQPHKLKGNIQQVIAAWPFMNVGPQWTADQFLQNVEQLGVAGVELFPVEKWHLLKKYKLICAATKSHTFFRGMNNKKHHAECLGILEKAIKVTADAGFPNVMTFTGLADTSGEQNGSKVTKEEGFDNCVAGYKKIMALAEKHKVTLVLEPLNSKISENMKGHPGYQGDHIDYCMEIIKAVDSPALKLLFDVYHIQVMDGDIIRNLKKYQDYIGHVQIAGVPGRGAVNQRQEINYPAVMNALLSIDYQGYVGHEWIPTEDAKTGLKEAVDWCDV